MHERSYSQSPFLYIGDSMLKLVELREKLLEIVDKPKEAPLIITGRGIITFQLKGRTRIPYHMLVEIDELVDSHGLRLDTIQAIREGHAISDIGLEIHIGYDFESKSETS